MPKALYERTRIMEEQRLVMENDLKNLGRMELLQVLLRVTESNEALMAENAELKSVSAMQISRSAKVGSIAEAALQANGFFEAAQRSADDYLREIKKLRDEMIERSRAQEARQSSQSASEEEQLEQSQLFERIQDQAKTYIQDVQTYANNVMARANSQAQGIINDARIRSDEIIAQANSQARAIIEEAETHAVRDDPLQTGGLPAKGLAETEVTETMPLAEEPSETEAVKAGLFADSPAAEQVDVALPEDEVSERPLEEAIAPDGRFEEAIPVEDPLAEEPLTEKQPTEELPVVELPTEGALMEDLPTEGALMEDLPTENSASEGTSAEEAPTEEDELGEFLAGEATGDEPLKEEQQATVSQSTAPLNIDVIVSDIAAAAFSEEGLDPSSTGALVRRGRHVKLPEEMAK